MLKKQKISLKVNNFKSSYSLPLFLYTSIPLYLDIIHHKITSCTNKIVNQKNWTCLNGINSFFGIIFSLCYQYQHPSQNEIKLIWRVSCGGMFWKLQGNLFHWKIKGAPNRLEIKKRMRSGLTPRHVKVICFL